MAQPRRSVCSRGDVDLHFAYLVSMFRIASRTGSPFLVALTRSFGLTCPPKPFANGLSTL